MIIKLTTLAALLAAVMSTSVYAHTSLTEDLHTIDATATDIIRYKCANLTNTTSAQAKIRDDSSATNNAPAVQMTVQIAAASGTTCPLEGDSAWTTYTSSTTPTTGGAANDGEGAWSANWTGTLTGLTSASYYCLKVTKNAATKDGYQVDHHCLRSSGAHGQSTNETKIQDE